SEVEWLVHSRIAREAGISEATLQAIFAGQPPPLDDPAEAEVYAFTHALQETGIVPDAAYAPIRARWGDRGVVELTAVVGYYTMVSMMLNAHHVPPPPGLEPVFHGAGELTPLAPLATSRDAS